MATSTKQNDSILSFVNGDSYKILWTIHQPIREDRSLKSQHFFTGLHKEFEWYLEFTTLPKTYDKSNGRVNKEQRCKLKLVLKDSVKSNPCKVEVDLCIVGTGKIGKTNNICTQSLVPTGTVARSLEIDAIHVRGAYERPHGQDGLRTYCRLTHCGLSPSTTPLTIDTLGVHTSKTSLSNDFKQIMENRKMSDIELVVSDQKFSVHKVILASRSPVFMATFENNVQEKLSNRIDIPDIDPIVMEKVLSYIYTNEVNDIEKFANDLIAAAEKYQLEGLKSLASLVLIKRLNRENAVESLILADLYHVDNLKVQTLRFIVKHINHLKEMRGFDSLARGHPLLLEEILLFISKHHS